MNINEEEMVTTSLRLPKSLNEWIKENAKKGFRSKNHEMIKQLLEAKKIDESTQQA